MNESDIIEEEIHEFYLRYNLSYNKVYNLPVEECLNLFGEKYNDILKKNDLLRNVTCLMHAPILSGSALIKGFVLTIMGVFSIIGNVATMYNINKSKMRRVGHIYNLLFHLSVADLSVTLWCILGDAIWYLTVEWKLGNLECKIFKYAQMLGLYLSTFIMVLIGVDRYIAIKYPMKSISNENCCKLIIFCWVLSATLSIPQVFIFNVMSGPFQEPFYQCVTYGSYAHEWQEQLYTLFTIAFTFIIPLTIIANAYILTVCTLHQNQDFMAHSREFHSIVDPNRRKLIRRAKMKSLRISFAIVVAFIVCWTPYYASMIYTFISRKDGQEPDDPDNILFTMCFVFGVFNSLCNPIIYGVFHMKKPRTKSSSRSETNEKTCVTELNFHRQRTRRTQIYKNATLMVNTGSQSSVRKQPSEIIYKNNKFPMTQIIQDLDTNGSQFSSEENTIL